MFHEITRDDIYRIETPRLWLRWPKVSDSTHLIRHLSNHEIADMTGRIPHPYPHEAADQYIFEARKNNLEGNGLGLVITPNAKPNEVIGGIGLRRIEHGGDVELGYWIGLPFWARGYASEAVSTLLQAVFGFGFAGRIIASVRTNNPASRRVLERNGFAHTHDSSPFMPARGGAYPVHWFELDRAEWLVRQVASEWAGNRQSNEYAIT